MSRSNTPGLAVSPNRYPFRRAPSTDLSSEEDVVEKAVNVTTAKQQLTPSQVGHIIWFILTLSLFIFQCAPSTSHMCLHLDPRVDGTIQ